MLGLSLLINFASATPPTLEPAPIPCAYLYKSLDASTWSYGTRLQTKVFLEPGAEGVQRDEKFVPKVRFAKRTNNPEPDGHWTFEMVPDAGTSGVEIPIRAYCSGVRQDVTVEVFWTGALPVDKKVATAVLPSSWNTPPVPPVPPSRAAPGDGVRIRVEHAWADVYPEVTVRLDHQVSYRLSPANREVTLAVPNGEHLVGVYAAETERVLPGCNWALRVDSTATGPDVVTVGDSPPGSRPDGQTFTLTCRQPKT